MKNNRLKEFRIRKNLTQSYLANMLKITLRQYQRYEAGTSSPFIDAAIELADFYGTSVQYLFGYSDTE